MSCICGYEFCYACRRRFTGSHYECENEGRKDFALIDGSDTIHPVVFGWCSDIRNRKQPKILKDMRRYLAMKNEDECLVTRYEQIVDFVERCVVHRYFKRKKINIEMSDVPSQQFLSALERFIFCMRRPDSGRFEDVRLKKVVDLGIVLCDLMSTACQRM
ncbi:hypothetical protein L596_011636 [Steinernema carpocapsae]|uniref:RBR-type E3 ubiquitin transferase n=1 Tax=Steinernema carpocapsae TaxID=34508 RepID=A0A4U5NUZ2_STECR|nr:hypothetical protein L596_011636 [Steinernema carpocapsae]